MKRISEDEVPDTIEILNILQKAKCQDDLSKKNLNDIQDLFNKYLFVQSSNPSWFIEDTDMQIDKQWTIQELEDEYNRLSLINLISVSGCSNEFLYLLTVSEAQDLVNLHTTALGRGFISPTWSIEDLKNFQDAYENKFSYLIATGFQHDELLSSDELNKIYAQYNEFKEIIEFPIIWNLKNLKQAELEYHISKKLVVEEISFDPVSKIEEKKIQTLIIKQLDDAVAGTVFILPFFIPNQLEKITNLSQTLEYIKKTTRISLNLLFDRNIRFHIIVNIKCVLIDIESGLLQEHLLIFPDGYTYSIRIKKDIDNFLKSMDGLIDHFSLEGKLLSTKWKLHSCIDFSLKIAKKVMAGCKSTNFRSYKQTLGNFVGSKCIIHPSPEDDKCFWRCLAIAKYRSVRNIGTLDKDKSGNFKGRVIQTMKANELKKEFYEDKYGKLLTIEELNSLDLYPDKVSLDMIPEISVILGFEIKVYTLTSREVTIDNIKVIKKIRDPLLDCKFPETYIGYSVELHYDEKLQHFSFISTPVTYGKITTCSYCNKVFPRDQRNAAKRLVNHELKHSKTENIILDQRNKVFHKKRITYTKPYTDTIFTDKLFTIPFALMFDFEVILKRSQAMEGNQNTETLREHIPIAVVLKSYNDECFDYKIESKQFIGYDCAEKFILHLESVMKDISGTLVSYNFRKYDKELRYLCSKCKCQLKVNDKLCSHKKDCNYAIAVRNLIREWAKIPIYGYNNGKYDMTFLVSHMRNLKISNLIVRNSSYLKFTYGDFNFLDAHNLVPADIDLNKFSSMFCDEVIHDSKEIFPYDWFDDISKLNNTSLPSIEHFHNALKNKKCTESEYVNAMNVWNQQRFKTFGDYMMFYCERDVDLLIRGLSNLRKKYLYSPVYSDDRLGNKMCGIDIFNYMTVSQIAYTNALKNYIQTPLIQLKMNSSIISLIIQYMVVVVKYFHISLKLVKRMFVISLHWMKTIYMALVS